MWSGAGSSTVYQQDKSHCGWAQGLLKRAEHGVRGDKVERGPGGSGALQGSGAHWDIPEHRF